MNAFNIESLSPEQKVWFANAMAGMITADGAVTDDEVAFLREAIDLKKDTALTAMDLSDHIVMRYLPCISF